MHAYGDAGCVLNNAELRKQFFQVPLPVLRIWVASDELKASSENTVVSLLQGWRTAHRHASPAARAALDASMQQVAAHVRLRHLSPVYLHMVLPQLPWFEPKQRLPQLCALLGHAPKYASAGDLLTQAQQQEQQVPAAWLQQEPRPKGVTHPIRLSVSQQQLEEGLQKVLAGDLGTAHDIFSVFVTLNVRTCSVCFGPRLLVHLRLPVQFFPWNGNFLAQL